MPKRSNKQIALTVSKQKQIINKIQQHYQQNMHFTLFQKLQYYDHVIGEAQVSRIDQWVLNVFRKIMEDQGKVIGRNWGGFGSLGRDVGGIQRNKQLQKQYSVNAYSSPNNKKANDDIQDPQLFSFSKTRKESSTKQKGTILTMLSRQNLQKLNKNKQHSDKPRYSAIPVLQSEPNERKVSEFNSQYINNTQNGVTAEISSKRSQNLIERDCDVSVYQLARAVKVRVVGNRFREFVGLLKDNVRMRMKGFKMRTSVYVHQLKLMKKTISGLKLFNKQTKQKIGALINNKNRQKTSQIFYEWLKYATRPQQQRLKQKQIKQNQTLLTKTLGFHKFLNNTQYLHTNLQHPQIIPFSAYLAEYKQQLKQKQNRLKKMLALKFMCRRYETKQSIKDKIVQLKMRRKGSGFRIFIRLIMCFLDVLKRRDDRLCGVVQRKIGARQFIGRVRRQYFFQKAYWNQSHKDERLSLSQVEQINNKVSSYKFLDQKYKKILFIYQILDCIYHSLHRKGYNPINLFSPSFMSSQASLPNMSLSILFQSHPSYRKFYLPYKLYKYFFALKNELITKKNQRMNKIKYQICGRRVLHGGLLVWYKGELQNQLSNKKIQQKSMILNEHMREKRVQEVVKVMGKSAKFQQAEEELRKMIVGNRICRAIMILKTYTISKNYYRKVILGSKLKTKYRTLQAYFLEWKLFYSQSMHSRITLTSLQKIKKKSAIRRLSQNIEQYSLPDRLHHKKCENLSKSLKSNNGQTLLSLLKRGWQIRKNGGRGNKKTIQQKLVKVNQIIQIGLKKKVLAELVEKWYQKKLCNQICVMVDREYERKLVFKCFVGMKVMVKVEREEKDKAGVIRKNVENRVKRRVLGSFIDKLIQKLYLRRTTTIAKKYWFQQFKNQLQQSSSDHEIHDLSP